MLEIILIRHGQTEWNATRRIMGDRPIPLNEMGIRQAQRIKDLFASVEIDAVYTSPVQRAVETAQICCGERGLPITETAGLAEIDYGPWVGKTFDEISQTPEFRDYFVRPHKSQVPGGENLHQVTERACAFVEEIKKEVEGGWRGDASRPVTSLRGTADGRSSPRQDPPSDKRPYRVIAVSHADVIKSILIRYLGLPLKEFHRLRIDNGSYSILWSNIRFDRILAVNALPHMEGFFEKYTIFSREDLK